jgi:ribosomal protein L15
LPKAKGFTRNDKLRDTYAVINLGSLEKDEKITKDMEITKFKLKEL